MPDLPHFDCTVQGYMEPNELEWLYQSAKQMRSIVEIGSWRGRSAVALLAGLRDGLGGVLHCVDLWERWEPQRIAAAQIETFVGNVRRAAGRLPVMWPMSSVEAAAVCPDADMVFIDGSHDFESVMQDISLWWPKTRRLLCGHDFGHRDYPGVETAVYSHFQKGQVMRPAGLIWSVNVLDVKVGRGLLSEVGRG